MRFSTTQHPFYCGIDLHARTMDVCILDQSSAVLVHRQMQTELLIFDIAKGPRPLCRLGLYETNRHQTTA